MLLVYVGGDLPLKTLILIRDENAACALESQIRTLGNAYETVAFSDSGKALQYLEENLADAVFLDIDGETDWQSFCGKVKYADEKIELILLSGNPFNAVKAFEAGAFDFLPKPVEPERLAKAIDRFALSG